MHIGSLSPFTVYKIKQDKLWGGRKVSRKLENRDFLFIRRYWGKGGWRCDPSQQGGEEIVMVMWDRDDLFLNGWVSVEEKMWMWCLLFSFIHFAPQQVSAIIYPSITINEVQTPKNPLQSLYHNSQINDLEIFQNSKLAGLSTIRLSIYNFQASCLFCNESSSQQPTTQNGHSSPWCLPKSVLFVNNNDREGWRYRIGWRPV